MTTTSTRPPARERTRGGLPYLQWSSKPTAGEAWPDKIRIKVVGRVRWNDRASFFDYLSMIAPGRFVGSQPTVGQRFRGDITYGSAVTGQLRVSMASDARADERRSGEAKLTLLLNLNVTTARVSAVRRNSPPLEGLSIGRFFNSPPSVDEAFGEGRYANQQERTLDGAENVLLTNEELGGATTEERAEARDSFLTLFEQNVRRLAAEIVQPQALDAPELGPSDFNVELDWSSMVLQQAEIYFERLVADPVSLVRRLFDRGLDLARRIKAQNFADVPTVSTYALEQNDGFPHLVVPLTGRRNIELSIYAKTNRRVRFEVRFQRDFGSVLRGQSTGDDRLGALLERLTRDAERRLPWRALSRAATAPPEVNVGDVPELISRLVKATRRNASLFDPLVRQLVITGGVIADDERQPGIERAVRALVRDGVLEHWTVQLKEQKSSRRYGLTHRFAEVRLKMLSGFLPQDSSVASHDWQTHVSPDHFEASANIAGGQHMVERPLDTRRVARRPDWS